MYGSVRNQTRPARVGELVLDRDRSCAVHRGEPRTFPDGRLELGDLFQSERLSEFGVSHLADNVVLLQYMRQRSHLKRTLTVLKTRASLHEPEIREFTIDRAGIVLGDPVTEGPDTAS